MFITNTFWLIGSGLMIAVALGMVAHADGPADAPSPSARGTFDVKLTPLASEENPADGVSARLAFDKRFHGDLDGTSKGHMMAADTGVEGSGAYVGIERITGTLHGRSGSFLLQHSGWMTKAGMDTRITVVPDSGTGQLTGLAGVFKIKIVGKDHFYEFEYTLGNSDSGR